MNVNIQTVNFDADQKLIDFVNRNIANDCNGDISLGNFFAI